MILRTSMVKFKVPVKNTNPHNEIPLRIVSSAKDYLPPMLNRPLLKALEDLGADCNHIQKIYEANYADLGKYALESFSLDNLPATQGMSQNGNPMLRLFYVLREHGIKPDAYKTTFLGRYLVMLWGEYIEEWSKIPIPGSYTALGLTDDCRVVGEGEVYVRTAQSTVVGQVLIYRNPIIHIGDIQEAKALSDEELHERIKSSHIPQDSKDEVFKSLTSMNNVVFFPQKGHRPFPNMLSGGDLDGDLYHILTKKVGFWGADLKLKAPASYEPDKSPAPASSDCDMGALSDFVGSFIRNDCMALLSRTLLIVAEASEGGLDSTICKQLGQHISRAVDFQKNGVPVNYKELVSELNVQVLSQPDYLRPTNAKARYDPYGRYYQSKGLLGQIWRVARDYKSNLKLGNTKDLQDEVEKDLAQSGTTQLDAQLLKSFNDVIPGNYRGYRNDLKEEQEPEAVLFIPERSGINADFLFAVIESVKTSILDILVASQWIKLVPRPSSRTSSSQRKSDRFTNNNSKGDKEIQNALKQLLYKAW